MSANCQVRPQLHLRPTYLNTVVGLHCALAESQYLTELMNISMKKLANTRKFAYIWGKSWFEHLLCVKDF